MECLVYECAPLEAKFVAHIRVPADEFDSWQQFVDFCHEQVFSNHDLEPDRVLFTYRNAE